MYTRFAISFTCIQCGAVTLRIPIALPAIIREGQSSSTTAKPATCCGDGRITIRLERTDKPFGIVER